MVIRRILEKNGIMRYLLDTNQVIYAINSKAILKENFYFISFVTEIELLSFPKLSADSEIFLKNVINRFNVVDINSEIKENTIKIRKSKNLKIPDAIIVATALSIDAILLTADKNIIKTDIVKTQTLDELLI